MKRVLYRIKNWLSDFKDNRNHNQNAKWLNSELKKRYYKPKSSDLIKILSEIEDKAGLNAYDIVPFLIEIKLMASKGSMIEEGSGGSITDRHRNDELFKELEQLEFIRILDNRLFSELQGQRYKPPAEECVLKVKLLPKGIDYLIEYRKKKKDYRFALITISLLFMTAIFSIPQACNNWQQYQILKYPKKNKEISEPKSDIKSNDSIGGEHKNNLGNGVNPKLVIEPISETSKHDN